MFFRIGCETRVCISWHFFSLLHSWFTWLDGKFQLIFSLAQAGSTYMLDHDHTGARRELKFLFNSVDIIIIMWVSERYVNEITRMWKSPSHFSKSLDEDGAAQPPLSRSCRWFSRKREPSIFSPSFQLRSNLQSRLASRISLFYKLDIKLNYASSLPFCGVAESTFRLRHNKCKFIIPSAELVLSFSRLLVEILSAFRDDWIIIIVIILNFHAHPRQKEERREFCSNQS